MNRNRRLKLGYNPEKTKNITTCLFLSDHALVSLKCVYNIRSDHIGVYQAFGKTWG